MAGLPLLRQAIHGARYAPVDRSTAYYLRPEDPPYSLLIVCAVAATACRNQAAWGIHCSVQRHSFPPALIWNSIPEPSRWPSLPVIPLEMPPVSEPWPNIEFMCG